MKKILLLDKPISSLSTVELNEVRKADLVAEYNSDNYTFHVVKNAWYRTCYYSIGQFTYFIAWIMDGAKQDKCNFVDSGTAFTMSKGKFGKVRSFIRRFFFGYL